MVAEAAEEETLETANAQIPVFAALSSAGGKYHHCFSSSLRSFEIILKAHIILQYIQSGSSLDHCGNPPTPPSTTPPPVPTENPPVSPPTPVGDDNSRLIAYLAGWQSCPSESQVAPYTHIVIAFAVSYNYNVNKNICSLTCEISEPPICGHSPNPSLVRQWQAAGKKVILSFGGAGMGGSWDGDVNDCWEYCYGREDQVTNRLVRIVNNMGLDGVDIDFEYDVTPTAVKFLNEVTSGLRNRLPEGSEITHAPMDADVIPGRPYYDNVLRVTGHMLDFLMPQYYNGYTRPAIDGVSGTCTQVTLLQKRNQEKSIVQ